MQENRDLVMLAVSSKKEIYQNMAIVAHVLQNTQNLSLAEDGYETGVQRLKTQVHIYCMFC